MGGARWSGRQADKLPGGQAGRTPGGQAGGTPGGQAGGMPGSYCGGQRWRHEQILMSESATNMSYNATI